MRIFMTIGCIILAGCTGTAMDDGQSVSNTSQPSIEEPPNDGRPSEPTVDFPKRANTLAFTNCVSVTAVFEWLGNLGPGEAPPGWAQEVPFGGIGSSDLVQLLDCDRVSWGSFERPMTLLFEAHDKFDAPASCEVDGGFIWILHAIWTNDSEFNEYLQSSFSLLTRTAEFSFSFQNSTESSSVTWHWSTVDSGTSDLTVHTIDPEPQASPLVTSVRYVWDNGSGVTALDYNATSRVPSTPEQISTGMLKAPTLHASSGIEIYAGTGDYLINEDADGIITEFGDYECTQAKPLL